MRDEIDTICKTIRRAAIFQENFNGDFDVTQFEADKLPLSATPHLLSFVAKSNDLDSMSTLFQLLKKGRLTQWNQSCQREWKTS